MGLFQKRRRTAERATGGTPKLTGTIPLLARGKIGHAFSDHVLDGAGLTFGYGYSDWYVLNDSIVYVLTRAWGVPTLVEEDVRNVLAKVDDAAVLDMVESWFPAISRLAGIVDSNSAEHWPSGSPSEAKVRSTTIRYRDRINEIFDEHDVGWSLSGEQVVPRASVAMHATVVEPMFALTDGSPRLARVEKAYADALRELKPGGDPADAITDAGTALQEMLEASGARGNALGPLLADARKRELLGAYDSKLADGVQMLGEWVSADRSARGDAHHVRDANRDDAWLAVRVAGALILRLAAGRKR